MTPNREMTDIETRLNGVAFTVDTDQPTYVVAPYNYSRRWKARSGGEELSALKASYNFLALPIDPGVKRVELEHLDTASLVFSFLLIGPGLIAVVWFEVSPARTLTGGLLALSGVVLIGYRLLEGPGMANTDLPERPAAHVVLPDGDQRLVRKTELSGPHQGE